MGEPMLTRRGFAGLATCAICAAPGFIATDASAQGTQPAATAGLTRKVLSQTDGPASGYVTILMQIDVEPGALVARHKHPGIESGYVIEGEIELPIEGQSLRTFKPGDSFQIPVETPHAGSKKTVIISTFVVEKDKPLASPA